MNRTTKHRDHVESDVLPAGLLFTWKDNRAQTGQQSIETMLRLVYCLQALDEDHPGSKVMYKKLFEEDREYNQGEKPPSLCADCSPKMLPLSFTSSLLAKAKTECQKQCLCADTLCLSW